MKQTLITLIAITLCSHLQAQYTDGYTKVTVLPNNQIKITNQQNCATPYAIRKPDNTFDTTRNVQPGESVSWEINPCGHGQVLPLVYCVAPGPGWTGIEFNSCLETLPIEEKINWTQDDNIIQIWLPMGKVIDKTKPQKVRIGLADGSYRVVEFPLNEKRGSFYYYKIKL